MKGKTGYNNKSREISTRMWTFILFLPVIGAVGSNFSIQQTCPDEVVTTEHEFFLKVRGRTCYLFVPYENREYKEADEECKRNSGQLAMPKTPEENEFITYHLHQTYKSSSEVWIGLSDTSKEGRFYWEDGTRAHWTHFSDGGVLEIVQSHFQDCVALSPEDGKWREHHCEQSIWSLVFMFGDQTQHPEKPYVCQYTLEKTQYIFNDTIIHGVNNDAANITSKTDLIQDGSRKIGTRQRKSDGDDYDDDNDDKNNYGVGNDGGGNNDDGKDAVDSADSGNKDNNDDNSTDDASIKEEKDKCPDFFCDLSCSMRGFQTSEEGCQICRCNGNEN